jgi:type I restriction enzyme, S subunit
VTERAAETGRPIEWLPPLKPGWTLRPLWSMFERTKDVDHPGEQMLSVFRDYGVVAKDSRENLNQTAEDRSIYQLVDPGWLVTNRMKAWQGSVGISSLRGIVSGHYICFAPRHREDHRYLNWLFRSPPYTHAYALLSRGVRIGQVEIDNDDYRLLPVLIPPLLEQRAIANYLDRETARIDKLIEEQLSLIKKLRERRIALVDHTLTRGVGSLSPLTSTGEQWLPTLPEEWMAVRTKRVLAFGPSNGVSPDAGIVGDLRTLSLAAITDGRVKMDASVTKYVDRTAVANVDSLRLHPGDVLIVRGNGNVRLVARAGLVGPEFDSVEYIYPDLLIRVRTNSSMLSEFFVRAFDTTATRAQIESRARTAVGTFKVAAADVRNVVLPLPPLDEQHRIIAYLDEQTARIDSLIAETEYFVELSRERRSAVITAAVTGQIDARAEVA